MEKYGVYYEEAYNRKYWRTEWRKYFINPYPSKAKNKRKLENYFWDSLVDICKKISQNSDLNKYNVYLNSPQEYFKVMSKIREELVECSKKHLTLKRKLHKKVNNSLQDFIFSIVSEIKFPLAEYKEFLEEVKLKSYWNEN